MLVSACRGYLPGARHEKPQAGIGTSRAGAATGHRVTLRLQVPPPRPCPTASPACSCGHVTQFIVSMTAVAGADYVSTIALRCSSGAVVPGPARSGVTLNTTAGVMEPQGFTSIWAGFEVRARSCVCVGGGGMAADPHSNPHPPALACALHTNSKDDC